MHIKIRTTMIIIILIAILCGWWRYSNKAVITYQVWEISHQNIPPYTLAEFQIPYLLVKYKPLRVTIKWVIKHIIPHRATARETISISIPPSPMREKKLPPEELFDN